MTEFDFDELDRSITEAMSKSGLLKEDGQHTETPTPPAVSTPSNPSSNAAPVSVEPNKLAPGPGPVANMTASPSLAATVGVGGVGVRRQVCVSGNIAARSLGSHWVVDGAHPGD